jgi:hypothetical protein
MPEPGAKDERTAPERYFTPYYLFPEPKAPDISTDVRKPAAELDANEQGTCLAFVMRLNGANDWCGAGFIPGAKIGESPARDLIDKDRFVVGFNRPVFLKWRARTEKDTKLKVHFTACGFASGTLKDGVLPSLSTNPATVTLTDKWAEFSIDFTEDSQGLSAVVSPLQVVVKADDNAGVRKAVVYVDDVRFEIARPAK